MKQGVSGSEFPVLKFLLVGDSGVGKSSLLFRFVDDQFSPSFITTVGIDFKVKTIVIPSTGTKVRLQIWDTAGQERFRTITNAYYRGAMAILVVYDVTNRQSFSHLAYWASQIDAQANLAVDPFKVFVGNKCDLTEARTVGEMEGKLFAASQGFLFAETSACSGDGVAQLFIDLAERIHTGKPKEEKEHIVSLDSGGDQSKELNNSNCC